MKNFIKKHFLLKNLWWLLTILIIILPFVPIVNDCLLEKFTFIITALAFLAAAKAIILQKEAMKQQKEDGKKAEELLKEQIEKQEIIGAWQLLNTKASGNSGKKEA
ncbi:MAG: hypothetical protein LW595_05710, partial [Rickettsiales bacterium]|nr:hypothetical protein [Rickettsiales bacterium]